MKLTKQIITYVLFIGAAIGLSLLVNTVPGIQSLFTSQEESIYLVLAVLFGIGYGLNYFAPKTAVPSFVWAIFFGMALQPVMQLLVSDTHTLKIVVELLAALVLFAGGIEVPSNNFKKYFAPIASISFIGTIFTIFLLAISLEQLGAFFGSPIPSISFLIMGAILASTDPTSIIPILRNLRLRKPFLRDIIISESAVNDVAGTIFTRFFLVTILATAGSASVINLFGPVLSKSTFEVLALEIIWGVVIGMLSAFILHRWSEDISKKGDREIKSDPALFFAVPIFAFAGGSIIGGSGFLAAFVAGLLFESNAETYEVRHFFDLFVNNFIKPIIFILLGAIAPMNVLLSTAGIGIAAGLIFILIIRPIVVFLTLSPWTSLLNSKKSRQLFTWRELVFMSFIRETGAIPAVLMLVALSSGIPFPQHVFAIGMWIILVTLIIEPPMMPVIAQKLGILKGENEE